MNREPVIAKLRGPPMAAKAGRPVGAFTLLELLVVIVVIALLVSILMPSLKAAKELARQAVCMSNQHQIGLALCYYVSDDGDGHYPPAPSSASDSLMFRVYIGPRSSGHTGYDDGWFGLGLLFSAGILDTERLLYCPSQKTPWFTYPHGWDEVTFSGRHHRFISYLYRLCEQTLPDPGGGIFGQLHRMSAGTSPSRLALSAESL